MSVYIKGMEMPTSCGECRFYGEYCYAKGDENKYSKLPCPLVPVPPHGRLIEESMVLDIVFEWCPDDDGSVGKDGDLREMLDEIEALPTIIPAEESET